MTNKFQDESIISINQKSTFFFFKYQGKSSLPGILTLKAITLGLDSLSRKPQNAVLVPPFSSPSCFTFSSSPSSPLLKKAIFQENFIAVLWLRPAGRHPSQEAEQGGDQVEVMSCEERPRGMCQAREWRVGCV